MFPIPSSIVTALAVAAGKDNPDSRITLLDKSRGWTVPKPQLLAVIVMDEPEDADDAEGVNTQLFDVP